MAPDFLPIPVGRLAGRLGATETRAGVTRLGHVFALDRNLTICLQLSQVISQMKICILRISTNILKNCKAIVFRNALKNHEFCSSMEIRWKAKPLPNSEIVAKLSAEINVSEAIATILSSTRYRYLTIKQRPTSDLN